LLTPLACTNAGGWARKVKSQDSQASGIATRLRERSFKACQFFCSDRPGHRRIRQSIIVSQAA
jgi:hypothetical protein